MEIHDNNKKPHLFEDGALNKDHFLEKLCLLQFLQMCTFNFIGIKF
jgi:hypothetical protein